MSTEPIQKDAVIAGNYRYSLSRIWDPTKRSVLFIGLNPSTADDKIDDHTITRCSRFAQKWGYGGMLMGNLFAYRATDPQTLKRVKDPIGPDNDEWLLKLAKKADKVVAVWGNGGLFLNRSKYIRQHLKTIYCLKLTRAGQPHHPRGLHATCVPRKYSDEK